MERFDFKNQDLASIRLLKKTEFEIEQDFVFSDWEALTWTSGKILAQSCASVLCDAFTLPPTAVTLGSFVNIKIPDGPPAGVLLKAQCNDHGLALMERLDVAEAIVNAFIIGVAQAAEAKQLELEFREPVAIPESMRAVIASHINSFLLAYGGRQNKIPLLAETRASGLLINQRWQAPPPEERQKLPNVALTAKVVGVLEKKKCAFLEEDRLESTQHKSGKPVTFVTSIDVGSYASMLGGAIHTQRRFQCDIAVEKDAKGRLHYELCNAVEIVISAEMRGQLL